MSTEKTLSIIKPDAVSKNIIGKIISRFEENGLSIVAAKLIQLSDETASGFYAEHEGKPFFDALNVLWYHLAAIYLLFYIISDNCQNSTTSK